MYVSDVYSVVGNAVTKLTAIIDSVTRLQSPGTVIHILTASEMSLGVQACITGRIRGQMSRRKRATTVRGENYMKFIFHDGRLDNVSLCKV